MKPLCSLVFGCTLLLASLVALPTPAVRAAYLLTFSQVGTEVVASGSGSFNLAGLSGPGAISGFNGIQPGAAYFSVGTPADGDLYRGLTGPTTFSTGGVTGATSTTGNYTELDYLGGVVLGVPSGYVTGTSLASTTVFNNATIASLGITPGTFTYTWGSGANADHLTINAVPEPSTWALLGLGVAGLGVVTLRQRARRV